MICFQSQKGRASIQKYLCSSGTQTHKLSGRKAIEDKGALEITRPDTSFLSVSMLLTLCKLLFSYLGNGKVHTLLSWVDKRWANCIRALRVAGLATPNTCVFIYL